MHKLRKEFISTAAGVNYGCWRKAHFQFSPSQATSQPQPVLPSSCLAHCMKTPSAQNANDTQLFISCSNIFEKLFLSNTCTASHTHSRTHTAESAPWLCWKSCWQATHSPFSFSNWHSIEILFAAASITIRIYGHPNWAWLHPPIARDGHRLLR